MGRDKDVLPYNMSICWPEGVEIGQGGGLIATISSEGDVVDQGIKPHVGYKAGVER